MAANRGDAQRARRCGRAPSNVQSPGPGGAPGERSLSSVGEIGVDRRSRRSGQRVVIVGGGRAGVAAAEELRKQGFRGDVVVLHDEATAPYDRPACAKGLLTGHKRPVDALLRIQGAESVAWRLGRRAVAVDPHDRLVHTDTGERYGYDGLIVASGAGPVPPHGWPM